MNRCSTVPTYTTRRYRIGEAFTPPGPDFAAFNVTPMRAEGSIVLVVTWYRLDAPQQMMLAEVGRGLQECECEPGALDETPTDIAGDLRLFRQWRATAHTLEGRADAATMARAALRLAEQENGHAFSPVELGRFADAVEEFSGALCALARGPRLVQNEVDVDEVGA